MFVEPHCCYGAQPGLRPSLPIDEDHPGGRVTTRSLSKEPAGAHGAMLTLLGMERDSRRSVSTCNYLCKINTVCCNVAHVHGLNCRSKSNRSLVSQGSAQAPTCTRVSPSGIPLADLRG